MSFVKKHILPKCANIIGTTRLIRKSNQNLINVFYHSVTNEYLPHVSPLYKLKSIAEFESDIDFILKHFNPVSIHEIHQNIVENKSFSKPSFHISFDDGLREVYTNVFPILKAKGIPATVFVNSGFVGNRNLFYRYKVALLVDRIRNGLVSDSQNAEISRILIKNDDEDFESKLFKLNYREKSVLDVIAHILDVDFELYLKQSKPYLSIAELQEMQKNGFVVGAHSIDHPNYEDIKYDEQVRQTKDCFEFVKDKLGERNSYFAFPFSDFGVQENLYKEIYKFVDLSFGISGVKTEYNGKHLQRIDMERESYSVRTAINRALLVNRLKSNNR